MNLIANFLLISQSHMCLLHTKERTVSFPLCLLTSCECLLLHFALMLHTPIVQLVDCQEQELTEDDYRQHIYNLLK